MKLALLELAHGDRATGLRLLRELTGDPRETSARVLLLQSREIQADPTRRETDQRIAAAEGNGDSGGVCTRLPYGWPVVTGSRRNRTLPACCNTASMRTRRGPRRFCSWPDVRATARRETSRRYLSSGTPWESRSAEIIDGLLNLLVGQGRFAEAERVFNRLRTPDHRHFAARLAIGTGISPGPSMSSNCGSPTTSKMRLVDRVSATTYRNQGYRPGPRYLDEAKAITPNSARWRRPASI